ncbi:SpoIID/LytB domain-containing protein [Vallitalea pronyensis]|uniref:SpoIID/LytB domain-containing protein n=1 Tax=Vallitalea pronyensis TaxID=1348613 RepID=A0A8J8MLV3_9FIRM|nr:SpoIID/LytB domain-containing protein [Vallitalea pronyensis]QUI24140.1 SpoIID/LytB domain-containing protein [Vallitalea pronyensis]
MKKVFLWVNIVLIVTITLVGSNDSYAEKMNNKALRIGLLSKYHAIHSLTMHNQAINMGYVLDDEFVSEHVFMSNDGYTIKPATNTYLVSQDVQPSYIAVTPFVNALKADGYKAYGGTIGKGVWKVYVEVADDNEAKIAAHKIKAKHTLTLDTVGDNGYRTLMTFSGTGIIMENANEHPQFLSMDQTEVPVIDLGDRQYRGRMEIGRYGNSGVSAVNVIGLNDYLYGVVPSEMPSSWPIEALKAQAVAVRNFAIYHSEIIPKYKNKPYVLCDTQNSQAYKGFGHEYPSTNRAVNETTNRMVYYNNRVVPTFYFSTSGGHTENSENVWSGTIPYLKGIPDLYELEPYKEPWIKELTARDIEDKLAGYDVHIGQIVDVIPRDYTKAGRVMDLCIVGTKGEHILKKETMRTWLGLHSRKFEVVRDKDVLRHAFSVQGIGGVSEQEKDGLYVVDASGQPRQLSVNTEQTIVISQDNINSIPSIQGKKDTYFFVGQGNGHGVGMSQSGAKCMAGVGFAYDEILKYYYRDIEVR